MPTLQVPLPGSWWSLADVRLRGAMIDYEIGPMVPTRPGGRWRTDERHRTALEAFTALDLDLLAASIDERIATARAKGRPVPETFDLPGGPGLRDFLLTFGPLAGGTGATYPVRNPPAERYEQRARAAEFALTIWRDSGKDPGLVRRRRRVRPWLVSFEGWAQGFHGSPPDVSEMPDDYGRSEWLPRFRMAHEFITHAVELADAVASATHWSSERRAVERVRDAFLAKGGRGTIRLDGTTEWRRIIHGVPSDITEVTLAEAGALPAPPSPGEEPAPVRPWRVDWILAGRMLLADVIGRHIQWAPLYLAVDDSGRLGTTWLTRSLEQVLYIQLMEHIQRVPRRRLIDLPYWPLPRCGHCGGVVTGNPRGRDSVFANRWHRGRCRKAGQRAEARARSRS